MVIFYRYRGSARLSRPWQAAMVASALNPDIRGYFSNLLKGREFERGIKLKMKVKLAAKLLVIAWTLMKRREQFKTSCFSG
jgi:hypothetical protein